MGFVYVEIQVNELELASLRQRFETAGYFIPKSEKFFLTKDANNIELWFETVWKQKIIQKIKQQIEAGIYPGASFAYYKEWWMERVLF